MMRSGGFHFGILQKILLSFLIVSGIPLLILGYIANKNLRNAGLQAAQRAEEMSDEDLASANHLGKISIEDSVQALDLKSTEAIEVRTVELASRIADFLHERDRDILMLSSFTPDAGRYLDVYLASKGNVVKTDPALLSRPKEPLPPFESVNAENSQQWRHRPPIRFPTKAVPLYKEITFVDPAGREKIKIVDGKICSELMDVSRVEQTYCKAEDYFRHLKDLEKGEIYVSDVIGAYVRGWLYKTPQGLRVKPESAYAGKENPGGRKFEGIVRWATPVFDAGGKKAGYVTMALDYTHVMEFTDHVMPTEERFSIFSDGGSGDYAFIWDHRDRCISHARDFFICGYDPRTGKEVPGWLSEDTYGEYRKSGLTLDRFVAKLPPFRNFTQKKHGSVEQVKEGNISLDCRVLDNAPQCEGWHQGTEDGGSGSFLIRWSDLWKLTTYAAIPYYTGKYGKSKRGFGYVTIGANVDDFHKDATATKVTIEKSILQEGREMALANAKTRQFINEKAAHNRRTMMAIMLTAGCLVIGTSVVISLNIVKPLRSLNEGALAMSQGNFDQSIAVTSTDEVGQLAATFNEMAKSIAEVDKMKSDFVTIASHELKTPIQAMLLSISGILEGYSGNIDEEVREDLLVAKGGIERLMRLVDNLLNLSRIEARKIDLDVSPTRADEIVDRAIAEVNDLAREHGHHIVRDLPADMPVVEADKDRIVQVVINLLSNSVKYSPDSGVIIVRVEKDKETVKFMVADNGYGIPVWAIDEIFKKFFQADSVMAQKVGGTGLGLTISKGIVEKHHGSITCESPLRETAFPDLPLGGERKGSVFVVSLPMSQSWNEAHG